jgi:hypothetical protein
MKGLSMRTTRSHPSRYRRAVVLGQKVLVQLLLLGLLTGAAQPVQADTGEVLAVAVYRTANFQINYRTENNPGACVPDDGDFAGWSAEAQTAMNHVVDILDDLLNSSVLIVIDACNQLVDPEGGTLAFAGPNATVTQAEAPALPVANRTYPIALANAIAGVDLNGGEVEIVATANSAVLWDYCATGCTVAAGRTDFVSTMLHELLHGLGFATSFEQSQNDPNAGSYSEPPAVIDDYVIQVADGARLLDLPNNSAALLNAMQQGSGTIGLNGPHILAINNGAAPFLFTPNPFQPGSSMSHWDDDHPTNLGRLMNAATGDGPSSRVVDEITLMALKDIGWNVNDPSDYGDSALAAYGTAQHINDPTFVHYLALGATFSPEGAPVENDPSDDGVTRPQNWSVGVNGGQITVAVSASRETMRGCLSGWIDWSADGNFGGPDEQIAAMLPVTVGSHPIQFGIPAFVTSATPYNARLRLIPDWDGDGLCDDQAPLAPSGGVFGGEVEDYRWMLNDSTVVLPPSAQQLMLTMIIEFHPVLSIHPHKSD